MSSDRHNPDLDAVFGVVTEFRPTTAVVARSTTPVSVPRGKRRSKVDGRIPTAAPSAPVVEAGAKMGKDQVRRLAFRVLSVLSDLNEAQRKRVLAKCLRLSGG